MIIVDGSYGEGGGQILRTALALSLVTGKPFTIRNIRAGRNKPGLMRQHLAAVNASAEIGNARVSGNHIGSDSFTFEPETIKTGRYHFSVGTAGSCTLVFQTVLPALMVGDTPSEIILEGGTHNPFAPPFDFLDKAFLPLINRMGPTVSAVLERAGFYPAGGGRFKVSVTPSRRLDTINVVERGRIIKQRVRATVSNLPLTIAHRELKIFHRKLGWDKDCLQACEVRDSYGPGNIITAEIWSENVCEVFTGFGERGIRAETVAEKTVKSVKEYLSSGQPAGTHLADQLIVPMALAGRGKIRTYSPTRHTTTNISIIKKFLKIEITLNPESNSSCEIDIRS
ncbi:MAG: RNA 3'-terminal phosphate cyclase [Candidatus Scalindua sp.]|nr:RNA 3'-terminal phosphate cyclase [Candidatus Scalindua sp.]